MSRPMYVFLALALVGIGCALAQSLAGVSSTGDAALNDPALLAFVGYALLLIGTTGATFTGLKRLVLGHVS